MKYYNEKSIPDRLSQADQSIINGQNDPELNEALVLQGYTEAEFATARGYIDDVKTADVLRREQRGAQVVATRTASNAYRSYRLAFDADRRQFRVALRSEPDYVSALLLYANMSTNRSDFLLQTRHFYEKVKEHAAAMALLEEQTGITAAHIDERLEQLAAVEEALRIQNFLKGQTRAAAKLRRDAMKLLDAWMKRYIAIARVAFAEDAPKLQMLGIAVKTVKKENEEKKEGSGEGGSVQGDEPAQEAGV